VTLSQIIARDPKIDRDIPETGHFAVRIEIVNGKAIYAEKTEKIK